MDAATAERVADVRAFNRFYTGLIGVLDDAYLESRWNVTEARVLFEIATRGRPDTVGLRRDLGLDSGYLSRMLARFDDEGLIRRQRSSDDRRRQVVTLTRAGRAEFTRLDHRAATGIGRMLSRHSDRSQRRAVHAMRAVRAVFESDGEDEQPSVSIREPAPGDYGWVVERHGALYSAEYDFDRTFEALVARIVADHLAASDPDREAAWIAELSGEPVGCVFCVHRDAATAQLRLLLVEPHARGLGVGAALVARCIGFAREHRYRQLVLWTNDVLVDARRAYERAGFRLVDSEPHHSFGMDLVGQNWALELVE